MMATQTGQVSIVRILLQSESIDVNIQEQVCHKCLKTGYVQSGFHLHTCKGEGGRGGSFSPWMLNFPPKHSISPLNFTIDNILMKEYNVEQYKFYTAIPMPHQLIFGCKYLRLQFQTV